MKEKITLFLLTTLVCVGAASAQRTPTSNKNFNEYLLDTKLFLRYKNFTPLTTIIQYRMGMERQTRTDNIDQLRLGFLYRPYYMKGLKFLANYQANWGLRHNEDWVTKNSSWQWQDSAARFEGEFSGGVQYRISLGLKGLLADLRVLFSNNNYNKNNNLIIRPSLNYYLIENNQVYASFFLRYEGWLALNFAHNQLWENWVYAGFIYNFNRKFQLGFTLAYKTQEWNETTSFNTKFNESFSITDSSIIWGINAIYRFIL